MPKSLITTHGNELSAFNTLENSDEEEEEDDVRMESLNQ